MLPSYVRGLRSAAGFIMFAFVTACGASPQTSTPRTVTGTGVLPAAIATGCVYPSTSAQSTALPTAGGVSGTIQVGAFAQAASTCLTTTVATGADTTDPSAIQGSANARRAEATSALPKPLLQVSLADTYSGSVTLTGVQLTVPTALPDGTYPATITVDVLGVPYATTYTVTVKNGMLTTPTLTTEIGPGALATLSVYPLGTLLPTPSPSPSPSASASPSASPTPTASPSPKPTPTATAAPTPSPIPTPNGGVYGYPYSTADNAVLGTYSYTYGGVCPPGGLGGASCSGNDQQLLYSGNEGGSVVMQLPTQFYGTVTFTIAAAPFSAASYTLSGGCPTNDAFNIGLSGGSITVPPGPSIFPVGSSGPCLIAFSTIPPNVQGNGYQLSVYFQQISF